jgi:hypothetical protein
MASDPKQGSQKPPTDKSQPPLQSPQQALAQQTKPADPKATAQPRIAKYHEDFGRKKEK